MVACLPENPASGAAIAPRIMRSKNNVFINHSREKLLDPYNLRPLFLFRSVVLVSELIVVLLAFHLFSVPLPLGSMLLVLGFYAFFNLVVWYRLRYCSNTSANEFFLHLVIDVLALTALFYFSGGSANPFVSLFLLPLVIVAATLPRRYVWAMAAVTLACYSLLMLIHVPLEPDMQMVHHHAGHGSSEQPSGFALHVLGMWFSFVLGVGVILLFVVSLAEALRRQELHLAEIREQHLRDEHMVALGTLAAGAAHELGTPLATLAVLTREMETDYHDQPELLEQIAILRSQVDRCKTSIRQISESAGEVKAESGHEDTLENYLDSCIARWQELHPECAIDIDISGGGSSPRIVVDETLNQALINLLNNASEASPERISLTGMVSADSMQLEVRDFGSGFSREALENLGKPFFSSKRHGHGLGFYLASEVLRRLGGEVRAFNHAEGGGVVSIALPLQKLKVA